MFRHSSFILPYSTLLFILILVTICNGGKSGKKEKKRLNETEDDNEGNANANKFLHSIYPHFEKFGTPFEPLEQEKDYIIKRNSRMGKVEWRLAEIHRNMRIKIDEFSMLDERNSGIEKKILAPAMTEYANCVMKMKKMKIQPNENTKKLFMLNGAITILDMKQIAGKRHAFRVNYVLENLNSEKQIFELAPTHFCTSLFIVEIYEKISEQELVCTRIDRWTEKDVPPRNIGKLKDCGHSVLYDHQLDEHLVNSGAENMLEFIQIKLTMVLATMLKRLEAANLIERGKHKNDQNELTTSIIFDDEHQIGRMDPNLRIYKGFMVEYNPRKLVANWLLERLTIENVSSKNQGERLKWNADPKLPKMFQPVEEDYQLAKQFKLNHGHLAGFRAHRINDEYQETFFYTNSVPQNRKINSGYWRVIEEYALCLAGHKQSIVYVYTGPLYIPEKDKDTDQWQMKYKVIGKRKMMAVPTHLFKVIFVEFTNEIDGKKSFWLESLVVSNGQEEEEDGNDEERERDQVEDDELEVEEEEEGESIQVEVEMGNNIWYNLDKNEAEIEQILKESQKSIKGKSKIPEATKKTESIQALVKSCQNRRYKIVYGDANSLVDIGWLLKDHRKSLTYIEKFSPNFQLLDKLTPQIRSKAYGIRFDEEKLAEFISKNEKRKDKDTTNESGSINEKEEKRNIEEETKATSSSRKFDYGKGKGTKAKEPKMKKKEASAVELKSEQTFYGLMEKLYSEYLLNEKLTIAQQSKIWSKILMNIRWDAVQAWLNLVKKTMLEEENKIGAAQINEIGMELEKTIENRKIQQIKGNAPFDLDEAAKLTEIGICWLIHLRESIFCTFLSASSHQKSIKLQKIALDFEQQRWKNFLILPCIKSEKFIFSKYDNGTRIAQIWVESANNFCRYDKLPHVKEFVHKYKLEMHGLQYEILKILLTDMAHAEFASKYGKFLEKNGAKSVAVTDLNNKMLRILGVNLLKKLMKQFPNLFIIAPETFQTFGPELFRDAIFDIELFAGYYRSKKYALLEILQFFDFYSIIESIEKLSKEYTNKIRKAIANIEVRRKRFSELKEHTQLLKKQLLDCHDMESNQSVKILQTLGQTYAAICIQNVFCRVQNLFIEIDINITNLDVMIIKGDLPFYEGGDCERMISLLYF